MLGNSNSVNNGAIRAEHGSNVAVGEDNVIRDSGSTATAGGDVISTSEDGSVIKGSDNGVQHGDSSSVGGSQTTTTVGGTGNTTAADGSETTTVTHTSTTTVTDSSTHDSSNHPVFDNSHDMSLSRSTTLDNDLSLHNDVHPHLLGF